MKMAFSVCPLPVSLTSLPSEWRGEYCPNQLFMARIFRLVCIFTFSNNSGSEKSGQRDSNARARWRFQRVVSRKQAWPSLQQPCE
jgi:hypothetical protein